MVLPLFLLFLSGFLLSSMYAVGEGGAELMERCLSLASGRDSCYAELCDYEPGYLCAEDVLAAATAVAGPERAMGVLYELMASPVFGITSDGHLLSHIIGRTTSRVFGSSDQALNRAFYGE